MISSYILSLRYYQQGRKIQVLIFLTAISLVHPASQSEQFNDIAGTYTESSSVTKASLKELKDSVQGSGKTVTQSISIEEKSVQQSVKKATLKPSVEIVEIPAPGFSNSIQRISKDVVIRKSNEIPVEKYKTKDFDTQAEVANVLDDSGNNTVTPKAKNVDLEQPIQKSEIISPETINNLKSGEKDDSDNDQGIRLNESVVEITQQKPKIKAIDKQIDDAKNLTNNDKNTVAPKVKNVDLEQLIKESEIISPETIDNLKSGEKDSSGDDQSIGLDESVVGISQEKPKTTVLEKQVDEANNLNNNDKNAEALKTKNIDLEQPIKEREIISPETIDNLKSGEKDSSGNDKSIGLDESVVEITPKKSETIAIDNQVDESNDLDNSENNIAAPNAKKVNLETPINEGEIVSSDTSSNKKTGNKNSSNDDKDIDLAERIVKNSASNEQTEKLIHDKPFLLLGSAVPPGTSTRLGWKLTQSFQGISAPTPVLVVNGVNPGPVLCLTAAIHGDEVNGIEIVRRILYNLKVEKLSGTVIGVPIVNLQGFRRSSRYLSDRRDLNRFFPGNPQGSSASRIAYSFFNEIIIHCNILVDLHTGSFHRTNMPQLRADLNSKAVVDITKGFGATVILQSVAAKGTLRRAALDYGIPAVTLEAGEPMHMQEDQVSHGVKGIQTLMNKFGMYDYSSFWGDPEPVYYQSKWIRANKGGILFNKVELGDHIKHGELLGTVTDPITNVKSRIISPYKGRVIGMALNQFVMPGYATFHIGIHTDENKLIDIDNKNKVESNDFLEKNNQLIVENEKYKSEFGNPDELIETE